MTTETAFTMDTSSIKFGPGVTREIGHDMKRLGAHRVLMLIDPYLTGSSSAQIAHESLQKEGLDIVVFSEISIEPTDESFHKAIRFASQGSFDGYVALGGGSTMDTAKAANLYSTYPASLLTYVNAPIGKGQPVPGTLKPLIAIPTTAGTGSETTGTAIFDLREMHVKTGISHRALRPVLGIIDPDNTRTLPRMVAACTGLDVLCHALESLTAI
ncbi:MAG: iron-containing alcohol dehydrogenase, partial [Anaerolineaceae bacterium]|nr:iron-containing alcohol dehydrogenase [Anaerolineaceae bacterium]